jgi:hypothetical protein
MTKDRQKSPPAPRLYRVEGKGINRCFQANDIQHARTLCWFAYGTGGMELEGGYTIYDIDGNVEEIEYQNAGIY